MKRIFRIVAVAILAVSLMAAGSLAGYAVQDGARIGSPAATNSSGHVHPGNVTAPATKSFQLDPEEQTDSSADQASFGRQRPSAKTPEELLRLLGERIVAKDIDGIVALHEPTAALVNYDGSIISGHKQIRAFYIDWFKSNPVLTVNPLQVLVNGGQRGAGGKVINRTASIMGNYKLEQTGADGNPESFTGNFCDIVRQQPNGTWLYLQDNPYPPHH